MAFSAEEKVGASGYQGNLPRTVQRHYPFLLTFILMFALWVILSGKLDLLHLTMGMISSALVPLLTAIACRTAQRTANFSAEA